MIKAQETRVSSSSLKFLTADFRLVSGAPKQDYPQTAYLLPATAKLLEELEGRVNAGSVSTEGKISSLAGLPLSVDAITFGKFFKDKDDSRFTDPEEFLIDARVSRVMLDKVVGSLRTLGFDAIGVTETGDMKAAGYLVVRGGFTDLSHLKEVVSPARSTKVIEVPNWDFSSPGAPGATTFEDLAVPAGSREQTPQTR
jgi:hypothetical protein